MKVPLGWLTQHLQTDATLDEITHKLTSLGLVVDGVSYPGKVYENFSIAVIVEAAPHPQADRLQVCQVDTGAGIVQVVCGAPNARVGLKTVLASPTAVVPASGMVIASTVMRGVESCGMLCSGSELGLSQESHGIMEIHDEDVLVGTSFSAFAGLDAPLLDVDVTPNRGDCFSMRGIARDLAATGLGQLAMFSVGAKPVTHQHALPVTLDFDEAHKNVCPHFTGRLITGVKNGPSPRWLKIALASVGVRSISILVDITNYMALDIGRPMHVFDAAKLSKGLGVRLSKEGESLEALDEKTYTLPQGIPVIEDANGLVSIAGIMGGKASGCTLETTDVFLESAYFEPRAIARAGQALGILSESRTRFERGVDPSLVLSGLEKATQLIVELCGGRVGPVTTCGAPLQGRSVIKMRPSSVLTRLGLDVSVQEIATLLDHLGCMVSSLEEDLLAVLVPAWRHDLAIEDDLIEEVIRLKGYDALVATPLPHPNPALEVFESAPGSHVRLTREWIARRALSARGMCEAMTWSFVSVPQATLFAQGAPLLTLDNPISQELSTMRPRLLPGLILAAARNLARSQEEASLFEVAAHYEDATPQGQKRMVAGVRVGGSQRHWQAALPQVSWMDVKADVWTLLQAYGVDTNRITLESQSPDFYHPGRSSTLMLDSKALGVFGELHPVVLKALDAPMGMVAFELFLQEVPVDENQKAPVSLSAFQSVERDLAFVIDKRTPAQNVLHLVRQVDPLITRVNVFDVYEGAGVPEGKKSLAITYQMTPTQATLTDAQIHDIMDRVIARVEQETGGALRA